MNEWIKVKDKSPPSEKVLAIFKTEPGKMYNLGAEGWFKNTIYACRMDGERFIIESHGPELPATHWMEQPDKPSESPEKT